MHFLITFQDKEQRIVSTSSWAACLAYGEGTGKEILNLSKYDESRTNFIIEQNDGICYDVTLKNNSTGLTSLNILFTTDFNSAQQWILQQQDKTCVNLSTTVKTYVTV